MSMASGRFKKVRPPDEFKVSGLKFWSFTLDLKLGTLLPRLLRGREALPNPEARRGLSERSEFRSRRMRQASQGIRRTTQGRTWLCPFRPTTKGAPFRTQQAIGRRVGAKPHMKIVPYRTFKNMLTPTARNITTAIHPLTIGRRAPLRPSTIPNE